MKCIWEFFEDLNEIVYVSDMETNELVYMNAHLRESLGFHSHEEYAGKKCHVLLQGSDLPCSFCTNHRLKPGKFVSWTHKNPVLNTNFLIKDSMIIDNGRKYRIELAVDIDTKAVFQTPYYYARSETILNECLQLVLTSTNTEESMQQMLAYIGNTFLCDRTYVFEINENNTMRNTYEWCAQDIAPQKEYLEEEPCDFIDWWISSFEECKGIAIKDIEEIREEHPKTYAFLKTKGTRSLVAGPINCEDRVLGFIGADNAHPQMRSLIEPLLNVIGYMVSSMIKRRDLLKRLNNLSFHDPLTGAFNRNAMSEHHVNRLQMESVGVIYCDITGLKRTNDTMGHDAGDRMIKHCYQLIRKTLDTDWIYRTGGDEFVCLSPNCSEAEFQKSVQRLREAIRQDEYHIAVGYVWSNQQPLSLEVLICDADKVMYQDKRDYYESNYMVPGRDRRRSEDDPKAKIAKNQTPFQQFLDATYYDMEFLFRSISQQNVSSYFYFGDVQKDLFYISDNMRSEFGFESNVVPSLLRVWAKRISTQRFKDMYWQEIQDIFENKQDVHDLRYQVRNAKGEDIWIRCYGAIKWNEDKTAPLFFSGRITHQDDSFVVDPITNFPRTAAMLGRLNELQKKGARGFVIGFSLNNIAEINNTRGRTYTDHLLKSIADNLVIQLSHKMSFYRLEGMRCIALVESNCEESGENLIQQIRQIIKNCYESTGISINHPCSFALMRYPYAPLSQEDFLVHLVALIRVAKDEAETPYIQDSIANVQRIRDMSNMELRLNEDVLQGMQNFRILIQPVVSATDGKTVGGEVLLRWKFEGKDLPAVVFIPILEKGDMIHLVGRWVFQQAARSCARLISYNPDFYLTFNVSLRQLSDSHFTKIMQETLERYHLDGRHLIAEITESCLDKQPDKLASFVQTCNQMGICMALDDFGTGNSSLQMFLRYPCSIIKLDRSLLSEITESEKKLQFIRSIVYACHQFGKKVCMKGIETEVQDRIIRDISCDTIQGYYYHRPMELLDFYLLLCNQDEKV